MQRLLTHRFLPTLRRYNLFDVRWSVSMFGVSVCLSGIVTTCAPTIALCDVFIWGFSITALRSIERSPTDVKYVYSKSPFGPEHVNN